jgi:HlyD family secretion protein
MDSQLDMQPIEEQIQEGEKKKKKRRKQNIISIIILVVGIILAFAIFGPKNSKQSEDVETKKEEISVSVGVIVLDETNQDSAELNKTGVLRSTESADAVAEYSGRVKDVDFNVGDYVKRDQILAIFDQSNLNNSAKVSYESAQSSYALAQNNLASTKKIADESVKLAKGGVDIAEIQYDQAKDEDDKDAEKIAKEKLSIAEDEEDRAKESAKNQINGAEIQLEQSDLQLQQAKLQYDKSFIKAPISGMIISKKINNEDYLNAGQLVAQISGKGNLESKLYLNADEVKRISVGDKVKIEIEGNDYDGRVESFSPIA